MPDPAAMFFQRLAAWLTAPPPSSRLGARGEREAGKFLRKQGLRILERNWRCRGGEIDLVCMEGSVLVFVEVKTRRGEHVSPEEQVDPGKQKRFEHAVDVYLARFRGDPPAVRFDVVAVVWPEHGRPLVRHWPGAFEAH